MGLVIGIAIAAGLMVVLAAATGWARGRTVRFAFEDRDTYLFLGIERLLGSDDAAIVTMRALREALRLKLASGHARLLVQTSGARIVDSSGFWLLVGALGPALVDGAVKVAVVCRGRRSVRRHFRESGIVETFDSESKALAFLRSSEAARSAFLDSEWVESLLVSKGRKPSLVKGRGVRPAPRPAGSPRAE